MHKNWYLRLTLKNTLSLWSPPKLVEFAHINSFLSTAKLIQQTFRERQNRQENKNPEEYLLVCGAVYSREVEMVLGELKSLVNNLSNSGASQT